MKKLIIILIILIIPLAIGAWFYSQLMQEVVIEKTEVIIKKGYDINKVYAQISENPSFTNTEQFNLTARLLNYKNHIYPGKYNIEKGTNLLGLVRKLRSGSIATVNVSFHNIRTFDELAGKLSRNIMADSARVYRTLSTDSIWKANNINFNQAFCYLIPNTYEFYWHTTATQLIDRLITEHKKFWNAERLQKAEAINLSSCDVSILASIVQEEQKEKRQEHKRIAGLYLNRLRIGMPLQADPTLKYAAGDFTIKRVLDIHKAINSPYNTYMYAGLPPSPISLPEPDVIDAVLNKENHDYLFMCAKPDFSGYHNFSQTLSQHNRYANAYRKALNIEMQKAKSLNN